MPLYRRRPHVVELLRIAVNQRKKLTDTRIEILERPVNIWYLDLEPSKIYQPSTNTQKIVKNPSLKAEVPFAMPMACTRQPSVQIAPSLKRSESQASYLSPQSSWTWYQVFYNYFLRLSRFCQRKLHSEWYLRIKMFLWPIAFASMVYEINQESYDSKSVLSELFYGLDIIVNVAFLIDSLFRLVGFYMFLKIEKAFNRDTDILELLKQCSILDLVFTFLCFSIPISTSGLWIRLIRLVFISSAVLDVFPYVDVLMSSMLNGLKATLFTIGIFFLLIFSYGSITYYLFSKNDPFHFGNYPLSCLTLFQMTTFENWSTYFYINFYGCDSFPADYYYTPPSGINVTSPIQTKFGSFYLPNCSSPEAQPIASTLVFISYILLTGFGVISMSLASVAIGIIEKLNELRSISLYGENEEDQVDSLGALIHINQFSNNNNVRHGSIEKLNKILGAGDDLEEIKTMIRQIWEGEYELMTDSLNFVSIWNIKGIINRLLAFQKSTIYENVLAVAIVLDCSIQIAEDSLKSTDKLTIGLHILFQVMFLIDVILTLVNYISTKNYQKYLEDFWAMFSLVLTSLTLLPIINPSIKAFVFFKHFRIFRVFRALKTLSSYSKDLKVILEAVAASVWSVIYVVILIVLFFSYYAMAGVLLLKRADPFYFNNMGIAMRTLMQIMTLDNWSEVMRNGIFGCYLFGYSSNNHKFNNTCNNTDPHAGLGWMAALYYVSFVIFAVVILNSLFVGMIITSMELLRESVEEENYQNRKVNAVKNRYSISEPTLNMLLKLFEKLDNNSQASLSFQDMKPLLTIVNMPQSDQYAFFVLVDTDHSGRLDFAEFSEMMVLMGLCHAKSKEKLTREKAFNALNSNKTFFSPSSFYYNIPENSNVVVPYDDAIDIESRDTNLKDPSSLKSFNSVNITLQSMKETFQMTYETYIPDVSKDKVPSPIIVNPPPNNVSSTKNQRRRIHPMIDQELIGPSDWSAAASIPVLSTKNRRQSSVPIKTSNHISIPSKDNSHGFYGRESDIEVFPGSMPFTSREILTHRTDGSILTSRYFNRDQIIEKHSIDNNSNIITIPSLGLSSAMEMINHSISSLSPMKRASARNTSNLTSTIFNTSPPKVKQTLATEDQSTPFALLQPLNYKPKHLNIQTKISFNTLNDCDEFSTVDPGSVCLSHTPSTKRLSSYYLSIKSDIEESSTKNNDSDVNLHDDTFHECVMKENNANTIACSWGVQEYANYINNTDKVFTSRFPNTRENG